MRNGWKRDRKKGRRGLVTGVGVVSTAPHCGALSPLLPTTPTRNPSGTTSLLFYRYWRNHPSSPYFEPSFLHPSALSSFLPSSFSFLSFLSYVLTFLIVPLLLFLFRSFLASPSRIDEVFSVISRRETEER